MASDSEETPIARAVLITLAVVVLYVLSIGPVWRAADESIGHPSVMARGAYVPDGPNWVRTFYYTAYRPIIWIAEHCYPAGKALDWYLGLW